LPHGQIRTCQRIRIAADIIDTRAGLAKIIGTDALARVIAPDAIADVVTDLIDTTNEVLRFEGIGRHAIRANVLCARIVVHGEVSIENLDHGAAIAVTHDAFAITRCLHGCCRRRCSHRGEGLAAHVVDTRALLAIIIYR
jgi:hypothetical protein